MNKAAGAFISEDICSIKDEVPLWLEDHLLKDLQIKGFENIFNGLLFSWPLVMVCTSYNVFARVHICVDMGVC